MLDVINTIHIQQDLQRQIVIIARFVLIIIKKNSNNCSLEISSILNRNLDIHVDLSTNDLRGNDLYQIFLKSVESVEQESSNNCLKLLIK